ncbi:MAG: hypothetical protein GX754_10075 [Clostridiaceae bacterium]|nr:hypothetical protein [Clostridiaceae bacterium]
MEIKPIGHKYSIIPTNYGKHLAVMILSEHDNEIDAVNAALDAMEKESEEIMNKEIEELRKKGIKAVSFKEAIKDMTPDELESFLEERNRKFITPLLNLNIEMLKQKRKQLQQEKKLREQKRKRLKIKRIK